MVLSCDRQADVERKHPFGVSSEAAPIEIPLAEFLSMRAKALKSGHREFSKDEIAALIVRAKRKERRALELVVLIHERFVFKKLRSMSKVSGSDLNELLQEGRIALLRAIELYDPEQSAFTTYLAQWLRSPIDTRLSSDPIIRNPRGAKRVRKIRVSNLDEPICNDGSLLSEMVASEEPSPEAQFLTKQTVAKIRAAIENGSAGLSNAQRKTIEMRFFGGVDTSKGVGELLNVSLEMARQYEIHGIEKLRRFMPHDE